MNETSLVFIWSSSIHKFDILATWMNREILELFELINKG